MCSLRFENNLLTIEGVRFASISKKTPLSKLSFAFVSLALPLLVMYTESRQESLESKVREEISFHLGGKISTFLIGLNGLYLLMQTH